MPAGSGVVAGRVRRGIMTTQSTRKTHRCAPPQNFGDSSQPSTPQARAGYTAPTPVDLSLSSTLSLGFCQTLPLAYGCRQPQRSARECRVLGEKKTAQTVLRCSSSRKPTKTGIAAADWSSELPPVERRRQASPHLTGWRLAAPARPRSIAALNRFATGSECTRETTCSSRRTLFASSQIQSSRIGAASRR